MERTTSNALLVAVFLFVAAVIGFILAGFFLPRSAPITPEEAAPPSLPGWCCMKAGSACEKEPKDAIACLRKGGKMFNRDQQTCDRICSWLKK